MKFFFVAGNPLRERPGGVRWKAVSRSGGWEPESRRKDGLLADCAPKDGAG